MSNHFNLRLYLYTLVVDSLLLYCVYLYRCYLLPAMYFLLLAIFYSILVITLNV